MDKVYAQAYAACLNNEQPFFNEMETKEIQERNESYKVYSMEEELISEFIGMPQPGEQCKKMSATEIAGYLTQMDSNFKPTDRTNWQIGIILSSKGFKKTKSIGITKYSVVLIK
jgi:tryptophan synthase beta subunit